MSGKGGYKWRVVKGAKCHSSKRIAMKDIRRDCEKNYVDIESVVLQAKDVLETRIIPLNI